MVKLFVGNLADGVDANQLRNLFQQYVPVQECDVLKNFAFVHVNDEKDAEIVIQKLNKFKLEGKDIHIERSTSQLRRQPGMGDKCFTCGAEEHKTSQCGLRSPGKRKRKNSGHDDNFLKKPLSLLSTESSYESSTVSTQKPQPQCWGYKVGGGNDADPELPCPQNPELRTLYEQYLESRTRYFFYREQLNKELRLQNSTLMPPQHNQNSLLITEPSPLFTRIDLTQHLVAKGPTAVPLVAAKPTAIEPTSSIFGGGTANQYANFTPLAQSSVPNSTISYTAPFNISMVAHSSNPTTDTGHMNMANHYNTAQPPRSYQQPPQLLLHQPTPLSAIQTYFPNQ